MNVDIQKMSVTTGIPRETIETALGKESEKDQDLRAQLKEVRSCESALEIYRRAPTGSAVETEAFSKALSLTVNLQDAILAFDISNCGTPQKSAAIRKVAEFFPGNGA